MRPGLHHDPGHLGPVHLGVVGQRLLVQKRGRTLKELAPEAGVTWGTLGVIERGEANPTWGTVRVIADALDVSIGELAKLAEKHEETGRGSSK